MAFLWLINGGYILTTYKSWERSLRGLGLVSGCNAGKSWVAWVSGAIGSFLKVWLGPVTNMDVYMYIYIWASIPRQNPKNPHPMVMGLYSSAPVPPPPVVWVVVGGGGGGRSCICMYLYMII